MMSKLYISRLSVSFSSMTERDLVIESEPVSLILGALSF